jgi:hypothetical protein
MRVLALVYLLVACCSDEKFACAFYRINSLNALRGKEIKIPLINSVTLTTFKTRQTLIKIKRTLKFRLSTWTNVKLIVRSLLLCWLKNTDNFHSY